MYPFPEPLPTAGALNPPRELTPSGLCEPIRTAWRPEYTVGIGALDADHRQLFELIAQAREAVRNHEEQLRSLSLLLELIDFTRLHFAAEEMLMQTFGYSEFPPHRTEHEHLLCALCEFQEQLSLGQEPLIAPLLEYTQGWLVRHILEHDRQYTSFFAERGARP